MASPPKVDQEQEQDMQINPQRAQQLASNIAGIRSRIAGASKSTSTSNSSTQPRLIAVSKLKPATDILALHRPASSSTTEPHTHFGENYTQELLTKSRVLPRSIHWHFIGGLQSNKCKQLAEQIPNLWCVSSVDSAKKADQLEKGRAALAASEQKGNAGADGDANGTPERLRVKVQVNTSGEAEKSGVAPSDAAALCKHIRDACPHLQLSGLMTIGAIARSQATTPENENEDFVCLREVRDAVVRELGLQEGELELSMGMSADFEGAIRLGSDEVRVGSEIFGERPPKKEAVILPEGQQG